MSPPLERSKLLRKREIIFPRGAPRHAHEDLSPKAYSLIFS